MSERSRSFRHCHGPHPSDICSGWPNCRARRAAQIRPSHFRLPALPSPSAVRPCSDALHLAATRLKACLAPHTQRRPRVSCDLSRLTSAAVPLVFGWRSAHSTQQSKMPSIPGGNCAQDVPRQSWSKHPDTRSEASALCSRMVKIPGQERGALANMLDSPALVAGADICPSDTHSGHSGCWRRRRAWGRSRRGRRRVGRRRRRFRRIGRRPPSTEGDHDLRACRRRYAWPCACRLVKTYRLQT